MLPFVGAANWLPVINFATFSTWCIISWTFVPRVLFSGVFTGFLFLFLTNGINTPVLLMAITTSCLCLHVFTCHLVTPCNLNSGRNGQWFVSAYERLKNTGIASSPNKLIQNSVLTSAFLQNWLLAVGCFNLEIKSSTGSHCSCRIPCSVSVNSLIHLRFQEIVEPLYK